MNIRDNFNLLFIYLKDFFMFFKNNLEFSTMLMFFILSIIALFTTISPAIAIGTRSQELGATIANGSKTVAGTSRLSIFSLISIYYTEFLNGRILKRVNRDNIYLVISLAVVTAISFSYVLAFFSTSNDTSTPNKITNTFTLVVCGLLGAFLVTLWLYNSTRAINNTNTSMGKIYTTTKTTLKYVIVGYILYYLLFKTSLATKIVQPIKKLLLYPVRDFIIDDLDEWSKITPVTKTMILVFFGLTLSFFSFKPFINTFINTDQKQVLATGLKLRNSNVVTTYDELNPNFDNIYQKTQKELKEQQEYIEKYHSSDSLSSKIYNKNSNNNHNTDIVKVKDGMRYNYGLRFEYFLHEVGSYTPIDSDLTIFDYGNKPLITFNPVKQLMKFIVLDIRGNPKVVYTNNNVKYQKWEEVTINFVNGIVDIFINRELVSSENVIPYTSKDNITMGSKNGVEGSIKYIEYSKNPFML